MKLWTWRKEGFICRHCGGFNEHTGKCDSCSYKANEFAIDWIRDCKVIKKTLHIRSSGFKINPFSIKVSVGVPQVESWYCYSHLCEDYRKYRKKSKSKLDCNMMMVDHYKNICKVILSQLRAMSANNEIEYVKLVQAQSKRDRKKKREEIDSERKSQIEHYEMRLRVKRDSEALDKRVEEDGECMVLGEEE